jgi:hypothetical protein
MKIFPKANAREARFLRRIGASFRTLMLCAAIVYSGVYMGDSFYNGMKGYVKYLLKKELKQKYNNPNQPDSYVNDPGRYWYS